MGQGIRFRLKNKASAEILLYEDVGEGWFGGVSAKAFAEQLKTLGRVETIDLRINSYGGDVFEGLAIYRQLVEHSARITSHIDGVAASIASVIAMAGDEIKIAEAGFVMIHNAWGVAMGDAAAMSDMAALLTTVSGSLGDVYAARTKNARPKIKAWMDEETWFNATDALRHGFATSVAENLKVAAHVAARYDPAKYKFKHPPAPLALRPNYDAAHARIVEQRARLLKPHLLKPSLLMQRSAV